MITNLKFLRIAHPVYKEKIEFKNKLISFRFISRSRSSIINTVVFLLLINSLNISTKSNSFISFFKSPNFALNVTRVKLCTKNNLYYNKLKDYLELMIKNENNLSEERKYSKHFKKKFLIKKLFNF